MPARAKFPLSAPELLRALERGETPATLALAHEVTEACVRWHIKQIRRGVCAPAARRAEEVVGHTLALFAELAENLTHLRRLREACLDQLTHAFDPGALDVGPHDYDLEATVKDAEGTVSRRPVLEFARERTIGAEMVHLEGKFTDPRTLLLKVMQEMRQQLLVAVQLADRIHNAREVEAFQREVLDAIEAADPDTAARIKGMLLQRRALRSALDPPGA